MQLGCGFRDLTLLFRARLNAAQGETQRHRAEISETRMGRTVERDKKYTSNGRAQREAEEADTMPITITNAHVQR